LLSQRKRPRCWDAFAGAPAPQNTALCIRKSKLSLDTVDILKAIGGIAAFVAAFISWRALVSTQRNSEASLVLEFMKEYSSSEMSNALRLLRQYKDTYGEGFASKWLNDLRDGGEEAKEIDRARRKVSHYFQRGHKLYVSGYVKKRFIQSAMLVDGVALYLDVNKPLEIALGASPTQDVFTFYESENNKNYYVRKVFKKNA